MEEWILRLSEMLYGEGQRTARLPVHSLFGQVAQTDNVFLEEALSYFEQNRLLTYSFDRQTVILNPLGKRAYEEGASVSLCLGLPYLLGRLRSAVVAIEVVGTSGDLSMGSGFFSADFPNHIVTAAHVARCEIVNIFNNSWATLCGPNPVVHLSPQDDIDLAIIECVMPVTAQSLSIDWEMRHVQELEPIIVAGYPYIPNHQRTFVPSEGVLTTVCKKLSREIDSLLISRVTTPGFSGGPVVARNGRVIGVVEQENTDITLGQRDGVFISATPAKYLTID